MEFLSVRFPRSRGVRVDGVPQGKTAPELLAPRANGASDFQKLLRVLRAERKLGDGVAGERGNCS